ncbi:MAG: acylneuraminate cytidylyltransferase family protein [Desulfuromonadaceae bacterium]|nr:acylneuraminate cytidylyltransferase family protein [Desulfuromonadaceae bacterium]
MFDGKRILAIIPARGGSKGLPGKNIRMLGGKPLIAWSIEAANASIYIDRTIISTDCPEISQIALDAGGDVPFLRPQKLATDNAKSIDVILHALTRLEEAESYYDLLILLQPTSPLRSTADIDQAIELLRKHETKAVVSVCETDHHPWWSNSLPENGNMGNFLRPEVLNSTRQNLPVYYRLNGAIYLTDTNFLRSNGSFFGSETFAFKMSKEHSIDIDDFIDFQLAEFFLDSSRGPI